MKTAADYTKKFAAEKAATSSSKKRNSLNYDKVEAQEGTPDTNEVSPDGGTGTTASDFVFNAEDYGLTKVSEGGSTDDGIIDDGQGNYYRIEGFERQQKDGEDTDKLGKSAELNELARKHTDFDVSTFNTVNDVQGALRHLAEFSEKPEDTAPEPTTYQPSEEVAHADAYVSTWDDHVMSGGLTQAIHGYNPVTGERGHSSMANWYQNYKDKVKENLQPVTINNQPGSETDFSLALNATGDKSWIAGQVIDGKDEEEEL